MLIRATLVATALTLVGCGSHVDDTSNASSTGELTNDTSEVQPACSEDYVVQEAHAGEFLYLTSCIDNVMQIDSGTIEDAMVTEWNAYCVYYMFWRSDDGREKTYQCDVQFGTVIGLNGDWL
jgi:hypothetical protein